MPCGKQNGENTNCTWLKGHRLTVPWHAMSSVAPETPELAQPELPKVPGAEPGFLAQTSSWDREPSTDQTLQGVLLTAA